jgi:hypothetical protein
MYSRKDCVKTVKKVKKRKIGREVRGYEGLCV